MSDSLTSRYIAATVRTLPPNAREDVRAELETSIGDAIESRTSQGESAESAERTVLTELGDPDVLAAGYADRPLHLIGPKYYLIWLRLLKLLIVVVPLCAFGGFALAQVLVKAPVGELIGGSISVAITTAVHVAFWLTIVFATLERTGADTGVRWNLDQLPASTPPRVGRSDMIASLVFLGLAAAVIIWDATLGLAVLDGESVPILNPALWPWWMTAFFVILACEAALAVRIHVHEGWTVAAAVVNTILALAFAIPALGLVVAGQIINPAFVELLVTNHAPEIAQANLGTAEQGGIVRVLQVITGFVIVGVAVWDILDGWLKTIRAGRGRERIAANRDSQS